MNYEKSKIILKEINKAKKILISFHRDPDPDSIGSGLALYEVLRNMGKKVKIMSVSERLLEGVGFLKNYKKIKTGVDFSSLDYSKYDLFIALDSSSWSRVTADKNISIPDIPIINIDHHDTNTHFGKINLVDEKASSIGEILHKVFSDWKIKIDEDVATDLLTAVIGDTSSLRNLSVSATTFETAKSLMDKGADRRKIVFNLSLSEDFSSINFRGEVLKNMKIDRKHRFVWSAIPYSVYKRLGIDLHVVKNAAETFTKNIDGTDFGFIAVEFEKNKLEIELRTRTGFDTSKIAVELGGGGHIHASGATVEGLPFDKAVNKILKVARKYAKK
jgi:phosphoesterase RecJ-like protein